MTADDDPACAAARGEPSTESTRRRLAVIFRSPVADHLVSMGSQVGYVSALYDPDVDDAWIDGDTDVVVTDHDRPELGPVLRDILALKPRWVGVMGSVRHVAPHLRALREMGVAEEEIARVHRPIGLNIGSRTPPEIALATVAGLLADRNQRPGGFAF
ncbi:MAG TPA: XdhC family protein [Pilimelia sp.]|nr:XdhC family protein [Pilimelia sp.]